MQSEESSLKRAAELAAIRLNIRLQEKKAALEKDGKHDTWDYATVNAESAKLGIAIGIIQDLYVNI